MKKENAPTTTRLCILAKNPPKYPKEGKRRDSVLKKSEEKPNVRLYSQSNDDRLYFSKNPQTQNTRLRPLIHP